MTERETLPALLDAMTIRQIEQIARDVNGGTVGVGIERLEYRNHPKGSKAGFAAWLLDNRDHDMLQAAITTRFGQGAQQAPVPATPSEAQAGAAPSQAPVPAVPASPVGGAAERLAGVLGEIMGGLAAPVDENTVRRIVEEALERQPSRSVTFKTPEKVLGTVKNPLGVLEEALAAVRSGEHILVVGPAGCGKSLLSEQIVEALQARKHVSVPCHGELTFSALVGLTMPLALDKEDRYFDSEALDVIENGGVLTLGEFDAGPPSLHVGLNTLLANGYMDVPLRGLGGKAVRITLHPECYIIADANTRGHGATAQYAAREALDGSTLDRFYFIPMSYDLKWEKSLAVTSNEAKIVEWVQAVRTKLGSEGSKAIVSSRLIIRAIRVTRAGVPWMTVRERLTMAFPDKDRAVAHAVEV